MAVTFALRSTTIARGVPFGAQKPTPESKAELGNPASIDVGISGRNGGRFDEVIASGVRLPSRTNGNAVPTVSAKKSTRPAIRSAIASLGPL
jgi:hypothetical protein